MRMVELSCPLLRAAIVGVVLSHALPATALEYPKAPTVEQVDVLHGTRVADPYRWLENDVRTDKRVADWVAAENAVTQAYLATLPRRAAIKARLTQLYDYERFGLPIERAGHIFFRRNSGLQNQSVLFVQDGVSGTPRPLLDPNGWSKDGATALAEWLPSDDGKHIAYAVQDGGTDWRSVRLLDVATGTPLPETLEWVKFSQFAWKADGSGFYYARYPATAKGTDLRSEVFNHAIWFHRIGTPQAGDTKVFATPDHPGWYNEADTSADGRWLVLRSSTGSDDRYEVRVSDLSAAAPVIATLVAGLEHDWRFAGSKGSTLYFVTNAGAPRYRVVAFDSLASKPRTVVAEGAETIDKASVLGDQLIVTALKDATTQVRRYDLDGTADGVVALPGLGTATGFDAGAGGATGYFQFASYTTPATVYRYDAATNTTSEFRAPKAAFDPADYVIEQRFFTSKDGTRVPMLVAHKRGLAPGAPTLLYGYGGFNINVLPGFRVDALDWMEMGGVFAVANIRGGGEYGAAWHDAGKAFRKQNVFDDFIAAGEYLIRSGITSSHGLAIQGGSNGGLLVGAVVNQRPDLFAAALPAVGVMDMIRFPLFTEGRTWTDDYGDPQDEKAFANLLAYSPYHNIRGGTRYPAIMVTTADTDDRVVPGHSFKYTARLQATDTGDRPHLIRIETRAGHGSGKPTSKIIDELADEWAFIATWTGMAAPTP